MAKNRWLLPNGIDELVADDARALEALRRKLLDLFDAWGYDLAIPPIVEFTDSLLTGLGENLDQQTFQFSDSQSGQTLGLRADISPQVARIDAHSLGYLGANRLCYAGTVVRANPQGAHAHRAPIQVGAELFGVDEIDADFEIVALMLTALETAHNQGVTLEVSHQSVRSWVEEKAQMAGLDSELLLQLIGTKRLPELDSCLDRSGIDSATAKKLGHLPRLMGGVSILEEAGRLFSQDALIVQSLDEMALLADRIGGMYPQVRLFFNPGEIHVSDYHSGLIFRAYCELDDVPVMVANGGRYNEVGAAFGRSRPATGFSADLRVLASLMKTEQSRPQAIYAAVPAIGASRRAFWNRVGELREQGYRVQLGYATEEPYRSEYTCEQQLIEREGSWVLVDFT